MTSDYNTIEIIVIVLGLYAFSYLMVKIKKINLLNHKRIWNSLLAVFFLISAIFGIILALQIDHRIVLSSYRLILWWHVEAGIIVAVISIFHIVWHLTYYKLIYKSLFKKNEKI